MNGLVRFTMGILGKKSNDPFFFYKSILLHIKGNVTDFLRGLDVFGLYVKNEYITECEGVCVSASV